VAERVAGGDGAAFLELSQLVTGFLARLRAYDFEDEWHDLIQEVVLAIVTAQREGRIRDRGAVKGFIWQVTRHKFLDRLGLKQRTNERRRVPLEEEPAALLSNGLYPSPRDEVVVDVRRALEKLPENKRRAVFQVYGEGRTYQEVASGVGVPLGTLKRHLREALRELREIFRADGEAR
jgi:RNA polymerase sigma-70 factor (ECF subfamily)